MMRFIRNKQQFCELDQILWHNSTMLNSHECWLTRQNSCLLMTFKVDEFVFKCAIATFQSSSATSTLRCIDKFTITTWKYVLA